jgi:putative endonuclease
MIKSGALAEQLAAQYLQQQGLTLLALNYRCRYGEIDLIMQDGETHVFTEVRLRSDHTYGGAAASIDSRKQAKLVRTAQHYLSSLQRIPPCRFDAIVMQAVEIKKIEWIKNAFTL